MEATKEKKQDLLKDIIIDEKEVGSIWELEIKLTNSQGLRGFGGRVISHYKHPITQRTTYRTDPEGNVLGGYNIDKVKKFLNPKDNLQDALDLAWLLAHPEVGVEGLRMTNESKKFKSSNPEITLKNLDKQETQDMDEQELIDRIKGRLSEEGGPKAIGLERLKIILAHFNLNYRDLRFIKDANVEKKHLRARLKKWAEIIDTNSTSKTYGHSNARKIQKILDKVDSYRLDYTCREMIRLGIIDYTNGYYKYNNIPFGSTFDSVIAFFTDSPEIYAEAEVALAEAWKKEIKD